MKFCSQCGEPVEWRVPEGDHLPRHICPACGTIHYQNPKVVTGCIAEWQDKDWAEILTRAGQHHAGRRFQNRNQFLRNAQGVQSFTSCRHYTSPFGKKNRMRGGSLQVTRLSHARSALRGAVRYFKENFASHYASHFRRSQRHENRHLFSPPNDEKNTLEFRVVKRAG